MNLGSGKRSGFKSLICHFTSLLCVSLSLHLLLCSRQIIRIYYIVLSGELNEIMNVYQRKKIFVQNLVYIKILKNGGYITTITTSTMMMMVSVTGIRKEAESL